jgi:hypothetical protein
MTEHAHPSQAPPERIADRYTVLQLLGRGGMADVYHVRDERTGGELALKRLRVQRPERRLLAITLFEREYYTLAQLTHPSVIRVHDYGVDEHGAHYTMELLQGADMLALGRRPWREACGVLRDVASALAVLHSRRWLHRDLSPRNVFLTQDGVAKLIDFGAMMPMGVAKSLVGTPPLVPPEAVQQQSLDAQADLYSLGALAYYMLTGRHAFPARSFDDLRDLWRTVVRPPEQITAELPPELSQLVLELLNLDRFARPASAAAVIERLDGLLGQSGDARAERPEAARAYLATPKLVGRDQELARVRERMVHSLRGRGAVMLIEGEPGSGRSRFLDACVLEARLLGAAVLRADASDGTRGDYGVATVLAEQLTEIVPKLAADVARLRRGSLARVIPGLAAAETEPSGGAATERRHVQTALRDWFRAIARSKRIVIAVDDADRIDEPSLAVLAALAHKSERRKLVLIATVRRDAPASGALELLRDAALRIELPALSAAHTEALLESVFAQAGNAAVLAHGVHELCAGNPREVMALADHLVQRGVARYAAGSWTLSSRLDPADLPPSIGAALASRLDAVGKGALALAETLALTDPRALVLSDYAALCGERDHAGVFSSLEALVEADILEPEGERYRFTHGAWRQLLASRLTAARTRELHALIARALQGTAASRRIAHHLMESGQQRDAIALLLGGRSELGFPYSDEGVTLLERAVDAADALRMPMRSRLELRVRLLDAAAAVGRLEVFKRFSADTLAVLVTASGLRAWGELGADLAPEERLRSALALAEQQHDALPEDERSYAPLQAVAQLSRLAMAFVSIAGSALDLELIEQVPSLDPFLSLIPALRLVDMTVQSSKDHLVGRFISSRAVYLQILERIDGADGAAMEEQARIRARLSVYYALGVFEAANGSALALERAAELEHSVGYRVNAWRLRMVYHATIGDLVEARRCERRAQLLLLQDGARPFPATDLHAEAGARFLSDDLDGLRQMLDHLQDASERFPARAASRQLAYCHYLRLKGDPGSALEQLMTLLQTHTPEKSERFAWYGGTHLMLLNALGRHGESVAIGRHYLAALGARGLQLGDCAPIVRPLSEALARTGETHEAIELSEALVAHFERLGSSGLVLGSCCEARARVAIASRDSDGFERWIARCRTEYERTHNPALARKLARLLRDAQLSHMAGPLSSLEPAPLLIEPSPDLEPAQGTVLSRMAECVDRRERARCALTLLLEESGATEAHLYGWLSGRLTHLGSIPESKPPEGIDDLLQRYVEAELRAADTTAEGGAGEPCASEFPGFGERRLRPMLLSAQRDGEPMVAAVAMIAFEPSGTRGPSRQLLSTLAQTLLDHDDVDALARLG